ncbi:MAG: tryptophan--tRNA ligase, partial [Halomonas sp.]
AQLSEPRERYNALMDDPAYIEAVLQKGAQRAREEAAITMDKLRSAVGLGRFI